ncbi:MAG TPA: serine/threonine-protein kinase, partial [Polyangiales bacterium]|nr:serine/threonine-protein kinase [Polyangiales bacterium]
MTTDPLSTSRDPLIGTKIDGRYHVQGVLGRGGMGVVYEGTHLQLERQVAIKVLGAGISGDPVAVQRFLREARTASQLTHGNIVDVQDLGVLPDGRPYLVMPKMQGIDLATLLRKHGPQTLRRTVELLIGAAAALDLIHAKGYVHRDVKPENLMYVVREDGSESTMLLDFGIVGLVTAQAARLTAEGSVFGTPAYLAPEAIQGDMPDRRGDVYALATVAFELLAGRAPFEADNPLRILPMKVMEDAPRMRAVCNIKFPESIENIIAKGLTRDPEQRWGSAGEFIAALDAAVLEIEELAGKVEPRSRSASLRRSAVGARPVEPVSAQRRAQSAAAEQQDLLAEAAAQAAQDSRQLEAALAPSVTERLDTSQILSETGPLTNGSPTLSTELPAKRTSHMRRQWLGLGIAAGVLLGGAVVLARLALHEPETVTAVPAPEPARHVVQPLAATPPAQPAPPPTVQPAPTPEPP